MVTIQELEDKIKLHNRLYWEENSPEISDTEYDQLVRELTDRCPTSEVLQTLGKSNTSNHQYLHKTPMLSLDKTYDYIDFLRWLRRVVRSDQEVIEVSPKYDGIAINYDGKVFSSRGDGNVGEIYNLAKFTDILTNRAPESIDESHPLRGELIVTNDAFEEFHDKLAPDNGKPYKHPRNMASGLATSLTSGSAYVTGKVLTLIDYEYIVESVRTDQLTSIKFEELNNRLRALPYPMDGIVYRLKDREYGASLGTTQHHPKDAIAYKFLMDSVQTELTGVKWSVGKFNIIPTALVKPITRWGCTISKASLHNALFIQENDVQIGDTVEISRAGGSVPSIINIIPGKERKPCMINTCPGCGAKLCNSGRHLVCPNQRCQAKATPKLLASAKLLGFKGIGERLIERLLARYHFEDWFDFRLKLKSIASNNISTYFDLTSYESALIQTHMEQLHKVDMAHALTSLNIPLWGRSQFSNLLQHVSLEKLLDCTSDDLKGIPNIGQELTASLLTYIKNNREKLLRYFKDR